MKVIGLLSRKGGVGKTTIALHLALLAQEAGRRTLLVDVDPQRSAIGWWRAREAETPLLLETDPASLSAMLEAAREGNIDLVVIDTMPSVEADAVQVAALADLIVVPTRPAILDLRAILGTLDVVKGAARGAMIALNACPARRGAGEASLTGDARRALAAFGVPVAPVAITHRAAFSAALVAGLTAGEAEPGGKAAQEMRALWRVVDKELNHEKTEAGRRAHPQARADRRSRASATSEARAAD
jgi:chromosome partitioning protein